MIISHSPPVHASGLLDHSDGAFVERIDKSESVGDSGVSCSRHPGEGMEHEVVATQTLGPAACGAWRFWRSAWPASACRKPAGNLRLPPKILTP